MRKVPLSNKRLMAYAKGFKKEEDVEFPELTGKMGFSDDVTPVLKIKAASLDDQLRANTIAERASIMGIQIFEAMQSGNFKKFTSIDELNKELREPTNQKTYLEVSLFHRCVVKPKFTMREAFLISAALPEVVNRVAAQALLMSSLENVDANSEGS